MKPEFIKLDKSLIRNIDKHPEQQRLVELLLDFALQVDTSIIAEGIETLSELKYFKRHRYPYGTRLCTWNAQDRTMQWAVSSPPSDYTETANVKKRSLLQVRIASLY